MKIKLVINSILTALVFLGCSSLTVTTDYDPSQDFSGYKTYRWATTQEVNPNDVLTKNPIVLNRVVKGINEALQEKGYVLAKEGEAPDFVVMTHAGLKTRMNVTHTRYGWYDPWWGPYGGSTQVSYYEEGSLVIDIIDWNEKELSWRGIGKGVVTQVSSNKEERQLEINKIVAKILEDFPPGSSKSLL